MRHANGLTIGDDRHAWLRSALVVVEVALALRAPGRAGLLLRTVLRVQAVDLGFAPRSRLAGRGAPVDIAKVAC